jgi:hypothetical protein
VRGGGGGGRGEEREMVLGGWGMTGGPHQGVAARLNHPRRTRARGAGGGGWAATGPKAGGRGGELGLGVAGPRREGEGERGRQAARRRGGWAVPGNRTKRGGAFLFIFPYFPLTIFSNPLLSSNFMESSK